jgi:SAM-dependent methyltransferase
LKNGSLEVIEGDFYDVHLNDKFDLICYFDSFGIGQDDDQRRLLKRVANWLKPDGFALIEVGATWFWARAAGKIMDLGGGMRSYDFDPLASRLIDRWWLPENPDEVYAQSLRCYTPADYNLLLEGTGLKVEEIKPGGKIDFEIFEFIEKAEIQEAMTFFTLLSKA